MNQNIPTLSTTMNRLKEEGYTYDFNLSGDCVICGSELRLYPDDFHIDKFYRFEGQTDPGDSSILYAISSQKFNIKGLLVNGYGIYSDPLTDQMIQKLGTH